MSWTGLLLMLTGLLGLSVVIGVGAGYLYFSARLEEAMVGRPWDLPSRLYPAPLELKVGARLPPGPLDGTLEALGYLKTTPVQNPGEYREAGPGHFYLNARPGWKGLKGVPEGTLDLQIRDGAIFGLRHFKGKALEQARIPPVPFAELREADQETRKPVEFKQFPKALIQAVVAIEDKRFWEHHGVDFRGLVRAVVVNVVRGGRAQGGSTLTQQLAKNYFLTQEKTFTRKIKELFYAVALERRMSKEQIIAMYLNEIYLGQRGPVAISGMAQAAYAYFSREIGQLKLEEAALLAAIIQAPNAYAPDRHQERARTRRDLVLQKMYEQGYLEKDALEAARKRPITLRPGAYVGRTAPYFVDFVTEQLSSRFPDTAFTREGFALETTLDLRVQKAAEKALAEHLTELNRSSKVHLEGAVVVMEPSTGRLLAMAGGNDYGDSQYNRAALARRQTGSVIKPLVYLAALQARGKTLNPTTLLEDEPLTLQIDGKKWSPQNNDHQFRGQVTVRQAIEQSLNVPTVRLATDVGMDQVLDLLRKLGFSSPMKPLPSFALGAFEATPLEVAQAYSAVASGGVLHSPYAVERVLDDQGQVLYQGASESRPIATPAESYMIRDLMRGVLDKGTARASRALGYKFQASGKTGTTNDYKDAWFVGFDQELLAVVWVGSDQPLPTGLTGSRGALPVWVKLMREVRKGDAPPLDALPAGLVRFKLCTESLTLAAESCPEQVEELFWVGSEPATCTLHTPELQFLDNLFHPRAEQPENGNPSDRRAGPLRGIFRRLFQSED